MLGAFGNGYRRTVGIVVGICRTLVVGLNAFHTCGNVNINLAGRNIRNQSDRLCAFGCLRSDSAAVNVYGNSAAGEPRHNAYGRLTGA